MIFSRECCFPILVTSISFMQCSNQSNFKVMVVINVMISLSFKFFSEIYPEPCLCSKPFFFKNFFIS